MRQKRVVTVNAMFKRAARYTFYVLIYLSGILIGGIYTPDVVAYVKQHDENKNVEKHENHQKPPSLKKRQQLRVGLG